MINDEIENQINFYHQEMQKAVAYVEIALDLWEETIENSDIKYIYKETAADIRRDMERICRLGRPAVRHFVEKNIRHLLCRRQEEQKWQEQTSVLNATNKSF